MVEEIKKETIIEKKLSTLQEAKDLNVAMEKGMKELRAQLDEAREVMGERILSGTPDVAAPVEKKEITDEEYAQAAKRGEILNG